MSALERNAAALGMSVNQCQHCGANTVGAYKRDDAVCHTCQQTATNGKLQERKQQARDVRPPEYANHQTRMRHMTEAILLRAINEAPGEHSITTLAEHTGMSIGHVSDMVQSLRVEGVVRAVNGSTPRGGRYFKLYPGQP